MYRETLFGGYLQLTCLPSTAPHHKHREVPRLHELVSYGTPSVRSGRTLHHLILVLNDDGLAHFWNEQRHGVVRHLSPTGHRTLNNTRSQRQDATEWWKTHNEYRACAPRVSGIGPSLLVHVQCLSGMYIYASSSVHNFAHAQKNWCTKRMATNENRWCSVLDKRV